MVVNTTIVLWGLAGGLVRAGYGLNKALMARRKIIWPFFFLTLLESAALGALFGFLFNDYSPVLNFFIGIGATDLIDNIYKLIKFASIKIPLK